MVSAISRALSTRSTSFSLRRRSRLRSEGQSVPGTSSPSSPPFPEGLPFPARSGFPARKVWRPGRSLVAPLRSARSSARSSSRALFSPAVRRLLMWPACLASLAPRRDDSAPKRRDIRPVPLRDTRPGRVGASGRPGAAAGRCSTSGIQKLLPNFPQLIFRLQRGGYSARLVRQDLTRLCYGGARSVPHIDTSSHVVKFLTGL